MEHDFWHERWKSDQIGFHQEDTNTYLLKHWKTLKVESNAVVFVPLAGKSKDILWLSQQGLRVKAVELSEKAVEAFFVENQLDFKIEQSERFKLYQSNNINFYCGDFFDLSEAILLDIKAVYDRASLIALPPTMRALYQAKLKKILPPKVKILLLTMEYPQNEMDGPPFSVLEKEVFHLFSDQFSIDILESYDVIADNPRFADRGLTKMLEKVYYLKGLP